MRFDRKARPERDQGGIGLDPGGIERQADKQLLLSLDLLSRRTPCNQLHFVVAPLILTYLQLPFQQEQVGRTEDFLRHVAMLTNLPFLCDAGRMGGSPKLLEILQLEEIPKERCFEHLDRTHVLNPFYN